MNLFFFDGCAGHHFVEKGTTGRYRIRHGNQNVVPGGLRTGYHVEKEVLNDCQHDGCDASHTEWRTIKGRVEARYSKDHEAGWNEPYRRDEMVKTDWFSSESKARDILAGQIQADSGVKQS